MREKLLLAPESRAALSPEATSFSSTGGYIGQLNLSQFLLCSKRTSPTRLLILIRTQGKWVFLATEMGDLLSCTVGFLGGNIGWELFVGLVVA